MHCCRLGSVFWFSLCQTSQRRLYIVNVLPSAATTGLALRLANCSSITVFITVFIFLKLNVCFSCTRSSNWTAFIYVVYSRYNIVGDSSAGDFPPFSVPVLKQSGYNNEVRHLASIAASMLNNRSLSETTKNLRIGLRHQLLQSLTQLPMRDAVCFLRL